MKLQIRVMHNETMEPCYIDRKALIMALYSNYDSIELEFNLLINKKMERIFCID